MKKTTVVLVVMAVIGLVFTDAVMAGRVGRRQVRQHERIYQGVHSGALTRHETRMLIQEQCRIQKTKKRILQDGEVTPQERFRMEKKQDIASEHIYRLKHNNQSR